MLLLVRNDPDSCLKTSNMARRWTRLFREVCCHWFLVIHLNSVCLTVAVTTSFENNHEYNLIERLIENSKARAEVRPVARQEDPIIVTFDLAYSQLVDLDGKNQILTSNVWVRQKWTNNMISWNASDYGEIKALMVSPGYFWKPDIVLYNTIEGGGEMYQFETKVVLHHDGLTLWFAPAQIKTICTIDITYFPFDEQKCNITFGSWSYTKSVLDMRLEKDTADLDRYTANGEWRLVSLQAVKNVQYYTCCADPFVDITYIVHVQRRVLFYLNNIIIPCIMLNLMTLLAFLLPHDSGERISLVITVLLGLTVYMLIFTENIPNSSLVIPIIGKFSMACFVEISMCLLVTTFTSRCYFHGVDKDMPAWFHYLIFKIMAPAFFINTPKSDEDLERERDRLVAAEVPLLTTCPNGHAIPNGHAMNGRPAIPNAHPMGAGTAIHSRSTSYLKQSSFAPNAMESSRELNSCEANIQTIADIMERYEEEKRQEETVEDKKEQWHFAAVILDRFFFILFGVTISISVMSFYLQIPSRSGLDVCKECS